MNALLRYPLLLLLLLALPLQVVSSETPRQNLTTMPVVREDDILPCAKGRVRLFLDSAILFDSLLAGRTPKIPSRPGKTDTLFAILSDFIKLEKSPPRGTFVIGGFQFADSVTSRKAQALIPGSEWSDDPEGYRGDTPYEIRIPTPTRTETIGNHRKVLESNGMHPLTVITLSEVYLSIGKCIDSRTARSMQKQFPSNKTVVSAYTLDNAR